MRRKSLIYETFTSRWNIDYWVYALRHYSTQRDSQDILLHRHKFRTILQACIYSVKQINLFLFIQNLIFYKLH